MSVSAGLTLAHCMFGLHEGAIRSEQILEFLGGALRRHLKRRLLLIWDGLRPHGNLGRIPSARFAEQHRRLAANAARTTNYNPQPIN